MSTSTAPEVFEPTLRQLLAELKARSRRSRSASFLSVVRRFLAHHRDNPPVQFEAAMSELETLFTSVLLEVVQDSPSASVLMVVIQFLRERQIAALDRPADPAPIPEELLRSLPFPPSKE